MILIDIFEENSNEQYLHKEVLTHIAWYRNSAYQNHDDLLLYIYQYGYYKNIIMHPNEERETGIQIYF